MCIRDRAKAADNRYSPKEPAQDSRYQIWVKQVSDDQARSFLAEPDGKVHYTPRSSFRRVQREGRYLRVCRQLSRQCAITVRQRTDCHLKSPLGQVARLVKDLILRPTPQSCRREQQDRSRLHAGDYISVANVLRSTERIVAFSESNYQPGSISCEGDIHRIPAAKEDRPVRGLLRTCARSVFSGPIGRLIF